MLGGRKGESITKTHFDDKKTPPRSGKETRAFLLSLRKVKKEARGKHRKKKGSLLPSSLSGGVLYWGKKERVTACNVRGNSRVSKGGKKEESEPEKDRSINSIEKKNLLKNKRKRVASAMT